MTATLRHPAVIVRGAIASAEYPRIRAAFDNRRWAFNFSIVVIENEVLAKELEQWRRELNLITEPWKCVSVDIVTALGESAGKSDKRFGELLSELYAELRSIPTEEMMAYESEPIIISLGPFFSTRIELGYGDSLSPPIKDGILSRILKKYENKYKTLKGGQSQLIMAFRLNGK